MDKFSRGQIFASNEFKNFAWIKFRESAPFSPNFLHFPKGFWENHDFKFFAWIKFREKGQNSRKSRKLIHAKIYPLKVHETHAYKLEMSYNILWRH